MTQAHGPSEVDLYFDAFGIKSVAFGPGERAWNHRDGERVSIKNLKAAERVFRA